MKHCLIVDDSSVIRKIVRTILEGIQYEVSEVGSAQEALERCKAAMPDVIFLDWHLPGLGAHDFLAALRGMVRGKRPLVLYCTTENDETDISRAFAMGADGYLLKPFDRAMLVGKMRELNALAA